MAEALSPFDQSVAWKEVLSAPEPFNGVRIELGEGVKKWERISFTTPELFVVGLHRVSFDADTALIKTADGKVSDTFLVPPDVASGAFASPLVHKTIIDRPCVGYNRGYNNYYHWTLNCLPAIYSYTQLPGRKRPTIVLPLHLRQFHKDSLRLARIDADYLLVQRKHVYEFDQVEQSNCLLGPLDYTPCRWHYKIFDKIRENARTQNAAKHPLVYVSRTDSTNRSLANEGELMEALKALGFHIASLSEMPLADQVRLFANAECIVAPHGAGLSNLVFCQEGCQVYELTAEHYQNPCFFTIAHARSLRYRIDAFRSLDGDGRHNNRWLADIDLVRRHATRMIST